MKNPLKRALGLIGAGVVVLGVGAAMLPADAASQAPDVTAAAAVVKPTVDLDHVVLEPGGPGTTPFVGLRRPGAAVTVHDVTLKVGTAGVARFAAVEPFLGDDRCSTAGTTFTCALGSATISQGYAALIALTFRVGDAAVAGDVGTVMTAVSTREYGTVTRRSTVTVAEPVAFAPGGDIQRTLRPGQRVDLPLTVRNTGTRPLTSTVMWFYRETMYTFPQSFSNCEYGTKRIICRFAQDVPAGATYKLSIPFGMTVRKQVPAPKVIGQSFHWGTPADAKNDLESFPAETPKKGTGGALRLVPSAGPAAPAPAAPELPQTAGNRHFHPAQYVYLTLSGRNVADLAAVGADTRGAVRRTVRVNVGARNLGPAFVLGIVKPAATVVFARPSGTTVTSVPAGCVPSAKGKPVKRKDPRGAAEYLCSITMNPFEPGTKITWTFKLRVDKTGARTGTVRVVPSTTDAKKANDSAKVRIMPPKKK